MHTKAAKIALRYTAAGEFAGNELIRRGMLTVDLGGRLIKLKDACLYCHRPALDIGKNEGKREASRKTDNQRKRTEERTDGCPRLRMPGRKECLTKTHGGSVWNEG